MTPSRIEPATFRFVAQQLNRGPQNRTVKFLKFIDTFTNSMHAFYSVQAARQSVSIVFDHSLKLIPEIRLFFFSK